MRTWVLGAALAAWVGSSYQVHADVFAPGEAGGPPSGTARVKAAKGATAVVRWRSQRFTPDTAPDALPPATRATLGALAPLAEELGYRLDVTKCGRAVCVTDAEVSSVHGAETALNSALEAFDGHFPGAGPGRVVVLVRARSEHDAHTFTQLADEPEHWTVATLDGAPFRVSAWVADLSTGQRKASEGRLVAEVTRQLLADRYGALPAWFSRGAALTLEEEVTGRFASVDEDATARTWRAALKRTFGAKDAPRIDLVALGLDAEAAPGTSQVRLSTGRQEWALVAGLGALAGDAGLGPIAGELARRMAPSGEAGSDEARVREQVQVLEAHRGPGVLARIEECLSLGRERPEPDARKK